jgi:hypothetical protein
LKIKQKRVREGENKKRDSYRSHLREGIPAKRQRGLPTEREETPCLEGSVEDLI